MRVADYTVLCKVLQNYFTNKTDTFDKLFIKSASKFHGNLFKDVEKLIFSDLNQKDKKFIVDKNLTKGFMDSEMT